jgi:tRNA(fMet)-specific endonuclease VapC
VAYLIDTNIVIHARDGTERVLTKFAAHQGSLLLSALCAAELQRGLYKDPATTSLRRARLDILLRQLPVLPFDDAAARAYGQIIAQRGWVRGRDIDRMIAGHAISSRSVLVTANLADFADIPGLTIENWVGGP